MTRVGRRLIEDFLIPALNDQRYGDLLKWIDRDKYYFCIRWSHKNAAKWTLQDTAVFQDWDKLKGHYHPEIKGYYMQAKQRFRAALYKLNTVRKLPCEDKHVKKYQLVLDDKKNGFSCSTNNLRIKKLLPKIEEGQKSIPTSVICKNSAYVVKQEQDDVNEQVVSVVSVKKEIIESMEDDFSEEETKDDELDQKTVVRAVVWQPHVHSSVNNEISRTKCSPQRQKPPTNPGQRTPHVPIQPLPVYSKNNQVLCAPQRRFESPHLLLVPIYNSSDSTNDVSEKTDNFALSYSQETKPASDVALNLSVKPRPNSLPIPNR